MNHLTKWVTEEMIVPTVLTNFTIYTQESLAQSQFQVTLPSVVLLFQWHQQMSLLVSVHRCDDVIDHRDLPSDALLMNEADLKSPEVFRAPICTHALFPKSSSS